MARTPNYAFERRQRELDRAAKNAKREEEKKRRKGEAPVAEPESEKPAEG
jgi:hypothetical protein